MLKVKAAIVVATIATAMAPLSDIAKARGLYSSISLDEFKARCVANGGQASASSAGGVLCITASGIAIRCYSDGPGGGVNCDVLVERVPRKILRDFGLHQFTPGRQNGGVKSGGGGCDKKC